MLIIAALSLITAAVAPPVAAPPRARATAIARVVIVEAARIDFKIAKVRIRADQLHSIDFE